MVSDADLLSKADYIHNVQYAARDLPVPHFSKPQEVRGGNTRAVRSIAYSCDGKKVATGCDQRGLRVWDARVKMDAATSFPLPSGGEKSSPHGGHVASVAWSPVDPNILVSGEKNSTTGTVVAIWDIRSPKAPLSTHKLPADVLHISFHPSGSHFAVVCLRPQRDEVFFFQRTTGDKWEKRLDVGIGGAGADLGAEEINSLRFSNSGRFICAVGNDGSLNAWSYPLDARPVLTGPATTPAPAGSASSSALALVQNAEAGPSRSGSRQGTPVDEVVTKDTDGDVEMADTSASASPAKRLRLSIDPAPAPSASASATVPPPTPSRPASPSSTPSRPSRESRTSRPTPSRLPTATSLPTASTSSNIQLNRIKHSVVHAASLLGLGFDPSGKFLAVGGQDALLSIFTTDEWICVRSVDISTAAIRHISFSPDGEMIAFGGDDQAVYIVSVHSGQTLAKLPVAATVNALAWHPTKNWLAYSFVSKGNNVWYTTHLE